ncbi:DUF6356 family protein [Alteriqipengyuania flavescens]|uniref:DUF6356 family protein n=1 Tax=Alteriqipengyuania flavescens TaxID=3053610 RepID=UPI0025B51662|nr:DUF6356 family protein [Alteriqipengyuania flavescens]WJY19292.1 DUF6356 family protein [Alteriqipengyuania flavescens]WJY25233.1 DUF6356 family protein [Alteriqipengyuania flavescens]
MKPFTAHPQTVSETYLQHLRVAASFGLPMIAGGIACLVHGVFPFLFERTGSETIRSLHERMVANRHHKADAGEPCHELDWCI